MAEAPASAPTTQTQPSTGEVINVSKQDEQGTKYSLTACRVGDIEEMLPARFRDLRYASAGFVLKWLFHVMMLGKNLIFYGETDVVYRIGRDMQRLWRIEREKDPTAVHFYHALLQVHSWMSASVTTGLYQFDEYIMWIGTTNCWDKQVYPPLSLFLTPSSARGLTHCCLSYWSFFIAFGFAQLSDVRRWTFRIDAEQEPRWFHASDPRAVVP